MEIIQLAGYTYEEKVEIASRHLIPKAILSTGLHEKGIEFSQPVVGEIVSGYTRESGVRELERFLQKLCSLADF